jgi:hypothetical protein
MPFLLSKNDLWDGRKGSPLWGKFPGKMQPAHRSKKTGKIQRGFPETHLPGNARLETEKRLLPPAWVSLVKSHLAEWRRRPEFRLSSSQSTAKLRNRRKLPPPIIVDFERRFSTLGNDKQPTLVAFLCSSWFFRDRFAILPFAIVLLG